jgi:cardiolipin synthase
VKAIPPSRASSAVLNIPNIITVARVLLVPVLIHFLLGQDYAAALLVFAVAAVSDAVDGFLARRFNQFTRFGAVMDPIADKAILLSAVVVLGWSGLLPPWLAAAIVARDLLIVGGALAYHWLAGSVDMAPSLLSKLNTFLQFGLICLIMANAAGIFDIPDWLPALFLLVLLSTAASGMHYVWVWGRKAAQLSHKG